jgi:pantoate--beta-alanine ligase
MGALHKGHISLIRKARKMCDIIIVSIFVNPKQFGPTEDYLKYPRPFHKDTETCFANKVDYVFAPKALGMYPDRYLTYVKVNHLSDILCGRYRPNHFQGVATVITKLFNIILPDKAFFGEKDYQQLKIIERLTVDLNFPAKIIPCPIMREKSGLALSSRNIYLNSFEHSGAKLIFASLKKAKELIQKKKMLNIQKIQYKIKEVLSKMPNSLVEYVKICDNETLVEQKTKVILPARILVAVWVGKIRLIDNILVE